MHAMDDSLRLPRSQSRAVFERLRGDVIAGVFPAGSRLRLEDLRERYGVSFAPIRDALARMAMRGLVDFEDQKGYRTKPLDPAKLVDIMETRQSIEELLCRDANLNGREVWQESILDAFKELRYATMYGVADAAVAPDWEVKHRAFHVALVGGAQSELLKSYHSVLWDQAARYRGIVRDRVFDPDRIMAEHRAIMDATLARDVALTIGLARRHIREAGQVVISALALAE